MDTKRSGIPSGSTSEWCVWGIQESEDRVRLVNLRLGQSRFIPVEQAAAAPDLLEALRGMLDAFPPPPIRSKNGMAGNLAHAAARAAIAKAEGE